LVITKYGNSLSISCFLAWVPSKSVQTKKFKHELHLAIKVQNLCSAQLSKFLAVRQFEPVLNGSVLVLFSSEKNLSVRFSVLKKWGENRTELNFGNTILNGNKMTTARRERLMLYGEVCIHHSFFSN